MILHDKILLVDMPFSSLSSPSLGLGILQAKLKEAKINSRTYYANLLFWEQYIPPDESLEMIDYIIHVIGELAFFRAFSPEKPLPKDVFWEKLSRGFDSAHAKKFYHYFEQFQIWIPEFIDSFAQELVEQSPKIIACTSTLAQHLASLTLLRRIKELCPDIITLIGGANLEAEIGIANHRYFLWLDYVFSGDADDAIVPLCRTIFDYGTEVSLDQLPEGTLAPPHRRLGYPNFAPRAFFDSLNENPAPDYDDYFETLKKCPKISKQITPILFYESSRGCRWGITGGCKFCGLNGKQHNYRIKKPEKVIDDLETMKCRYGINYFEMTDNMVPPEYQESLFPELIRRGSPYRLFYETRVSVSRDYFRCMKEAGVMALQPGIENLSTPVLKHMNKGIQSWQAIQCLKWSRLFGFFSSWHIMWGFPEEKLSWYESMETLIPKLFHLQSPQRFNKMEYCRFSEFWEQYRTTNNLVPDDMSRSTFLFEEPMRSDLAYRFKNTTQNSEHYSPLFRSKLPWLIMVWQQHSKDKVVLLSVPEGDGLKICDTRPEVRLIPLPDLWIPYCHHKQSEYFMDAREKSMLDDCDTAPFEENFLKKWGKDGTDFIEKNCERNLIIRIDQRLLSLVLPGPLPKQPVTLYEALL
ncbi:MAG: RiPP maturation radical SAM C-methyltransferase [Planctomycetaceae bacterium]|jgi:magnesium-protoporphyrin IX monomethyl ester (oxidative) cyclase|nr:RiPP maturation radical SAM C-methyltransferase [Planctomycetaceae bacterium]